MTTPEAGTSRGPKSPSERSAPLVLVLPGQHRFVAGLEGTEVESLRAPGRFANGELVAEVPDHVHGRSCIVVATVAPPPGAIERLTVVTQALRRAGAADVAALVPYLAYARQDRADTAQSLGLAWLGSLLHAGGIDRIACVDVHGRSAPELLGMPVASIAPAPVLAAALPPQWRTDVTFVAPDEGAVDRCLALTLAVGASEPIVWLRKRRTRSGVQHAGLVGTPGPRAVIVDDILDTGGTLVSCCRELQRAGVQQIGVAVTHGLFTGEGWRELFDLGVTRMWITDTVLSRRRPEQAAVVPVAPLLGPWLQGR
ncbi:ribose-phosphate diphosphokinase [Baekduia soli]|uniref:Ribose-phosphate diphosphokinase n=1 Tax=Baekduia soli TaxID=496014 RepID=A0A5B8U598_9ACTN|nr:ribose-phosphate diphosphokinase [Baekduia soli]QEC48299.1 ribose-phosphate diphosphokinase [Baekduia soli]